MDDTSERLMALALHGIESHAKWMESSAARLSEYANLLVAQRPFETLAEAQLDVTEKALTDALESVRKTRAHYQSLPREKAVV